MKPLTWIKKIEPVPCLSGFNTKLSRTSAFTPDRSQSSMPHLFSFKCAYIYSSSKLKFLGRSSSVNNVCFLKVLYKTSPFTKTESRSDWSYLFFTLIVEYENANNAMQAYLIPSISPNKVFPCLNKAWSAITVAAILFLQQE